VLDRSPEYRPTDVENPDPARRNRPIVGLQVLSGFKPAPNAWEGGQAYDPKKGKQLPLEHAAEPRRIAAHHRLRAGDLPVGALDTDPLGVLQQPGDLAQHVGVVLGLAGALDQVLAVRPRSSAPS
jgi:hypothetical protein